MELGIIPFWCMEEGDVMKALHENIRNFRQLRKLTQKEFADRLNKSRNVISNWERGTNAPDPDTIEQICKILDVTPNMLFGWDRCPDYERYLDKLKSYNIRLEELTKQKARIEAMLAETKKLLDEEMAGEE